MFRKNYYLHGFTSYVVNKPVMCHLLLLWSCGLKYRLLYRANFKSTYRHETLLFISKLDDIFEFKNIARYWLKFCQISETRYVILLIDTELQTSTKYPGLRKFNICLLSLDFTLYGYNS